MWLLFNLVEGFGSIKFGDWYAWLPVMEGERCLDYQVSGRSQEYLVQIYNQINGKYFPKLLTKWMCIDLDG